MQSAYLLLFLTSLAVTCGTPCTQTRSQNHERLVCRPRTKTTKHCRRVFMTLQTMPSPANAVSMTECVLSCVKFVARRQRFLAKILNNNENSRTSSGERNGKQKQNKAESTREVEIRTTKGFPAEGKACVAIF